MIFFLMLEIGPQIHFSFLNGRWLRLTYNSKRQKEGMGQFLKIISLYSKYSVSWHHTEKHPPAIDFLCPSWT